MHANITSCIQIILLSEQRTVNEQNNEVELLVSYDRQPFNVAQIPFEESHLVSDS